MSSQKHLIAAIDDELDLIELYADLFSDSFEVRGFLSPVEFLKAIDENQLPGLVLVISDYRMPKMTGLEMLSILHQKGCRVATLLLSGYIDKDVAVSALNTGISKVLEKPADTELLVSTALGLIKKFRLDRIEHETMELSGQLSELYVLYRDLLSSDTMKDPQGILTVDELTHEVKAQSPLDLISGLEKKIASLQIEKTLLQQGSI